MSDSYLFTFAAKGLQPYIMNGGKLRDMVGATSLIDKLSDEKLLQSWLTKKFEVAADDFEILQAAAGGARIRFANESAAKRVARLWPLWCRAWAPELDVVQHLEQWSVGDNFGNVSKTAAKALEQNRNFPAARMPEAGPFVQRAPRTGGPAVQVDRSTDDEWIDTATVRKRAERDALGGKNELPPVARAFGFTRADQLPNDFTDISGPDRHYLAVIHADGNRLGQMFLDVGRAMEKCGPRDLDDETAVNLFRYLSQQLVADGTRAATRKAMTALPEKVRPDGEPWLFAPIVLAGDDVTVVCRADLGLPFTEAFLKAFREEMEERLESLRNESWWGNVPDQVKRNVPRSLSAGAGVVFCTDHYPFSLAYELCESLASEAKGEAKKRNKEHDKKQPADRPAPPSALSFARVTGGTAPTRFDELTKGLLKGAAETLLTGCPYFVDGPEAPQFVNLWTVFEKVRPKPDPDDPGGKRRIGLPGSTLRGLLNLQRTDWEQVSEAVERMREVASDSGNSGSPSTRVWEEFEQAWKRLCGWAGEKNNSMGKRSDQTRPLWRSQKMARQSGDPVQDRGEASGECPDEADVGLRPDWRSLRFYDANTKAEKLSSPLLDLLTLLAIRDKEEDAQTTDQNFKTQPVETS